MTTKTPESGKAGGSQPQTSCPITDKPIDNDLYVEQDGKRIHVCSTDCLNAVRNAFPMYAEQLENKGIDLRIPPDTVQERKPMRKAA